MSGLLNKVKDAVQDAKSSSGSSGTTGQSTTGSSGTDSKVNNYANEGIDQVTDKVGLGDKYDSQIDKVADGQLDKRF